MDEPHSGGRQRLLNRWIVRGAASFYPQTEDLPGLTDAELHAFVDAFRAESTWPLWLGVAAGAVIFEVSPLFTTGRPRRASKLSATLRDRHANTLGSHPDYYVRQSVFLLKMIGGFAWAKHPRTRQAFHMEPYPEDPATWRRS